MGSVLELGSLVSTALLVSVLEQAHAPFEDLLTAYISQPQPQRLHENMLKPKNS